MNANAMTIKHAYLFTGLAMVIIPVVLLATGVLIPGLAFSFELYGLEFAYNISMFLYCGLIFGGLAISAQYFRSIQTRLFPSRASPATEGESTDYQVLSIPWSRFLAGAMLVFMGVLSFALLGIGFSDKDKISLWLYLGGPSVSFPAGFLPLVVGIILLFYAWSAMKTITMQHENGTLVIRESRPVMEITTRIPSNDIRLARATNAATGPRLLWIVFFSFQILLLFIDGISFITNPHAFGAASLVGTMYVLSACVQSVAMVLLLFGGNQALTIITGENIYTLNYYILPWHKDGSGEMTLLERVLGKPFPAAFSETLQEMHHPVSYTPLVLGIALLVLPIISRALYVYGGEVLWFGFFMLGGIVLVQWIKNDLVLGKNGVVARGVTGSGPKHVVSRRGSFFDEYFINLVDNDSTGLKSRVDLVATLRLRKLILPDHLVATGIAALTGMDMLLTAMLAPAGSSFTPGAIVEHGCIGIGLIALAFIVTFDPRASIEASFVHWTYQVLVVPGSERSKWWHSRMMEIARKDPRKLVMAIGEFAVAIVVGMLLAIAFVL
jgi:hypothetical protein